MQINTVKHALKAGKLQLGMNFGQLRSPEIPRLLAAAGFHWAFIDTEHGGFDLETVQDVCRVAQMAGICPVVRVVDLQYVWAPAIYGGDDFIRAEFNRRASVLCERRDRFNPQPDFGLASAESGLRELDFGIWDRLLLNDRLLVSYPQVRPTSIRPQ